MELCVTSDLLYSPDDYKLSLLNSVWRQATEKFLASRGGSTMEFFGSLGFFVSFTMTSDLPHYFHALPYMGHSLLNIVQIPDLFYLVSKRNEMLRIKFSYISNGQSPFTFFLQGRLLWNIVLAGQRYAAFVYAANITLTA